MALTASQETAYNLSEVLGLVRGTITCCLCSRKVTPKNPREIKHVVCQHCGHPTVYIRIKYQGERLRLYNDKKTGVSFTYASALKALVDINAELEAKTFDPKEWEAEAIQGRLFENKLDEWIEQKERERARNKIKPSTVGNYLTYRKLYFLPSRHLVGHDVREIRLKHLQFFYDGLVGSEKYRKNIMDALHTFFRWLKRWGEIAEIPTWPELDEVVHKEKFALTREEQEAALARIPEEHRDIIEFAMEAGLRPAEACALMVLDIEPERRRACFRRTYSEGELVYKTKNMKREVWIPLSDRAWELVEKNVKSSDQGFVFINQRTGRGYKYKFPYRIWKELSGTQVSFGEATRHSFVTQLIEDGIPEDQTMFLGRWVDKRSLKHYYHPTDDKTRDVLNRRGKPRKIISIDEGKK
jgi:integrase